MLVMVRKAKCSRTVFKRQQIVLVHMISDTGPCLFVSVDIVQEIAVMYEISKGLVGSDSNQRPSEYETEEPTPFIPHLTTYST